MSTANYAQRLVFVLCATLTFSAGHAQPPGLKVGQGYWDVAPHARQETTAFGVTLHACPLGFAMGGANVVENGFSCTRVVPLGKESSVHTVYDRGTQKDFGTGSMHVCPAGMYMRGFHEGLNILACSDGVTLAPSFLDPSGKTQMATKGLNQDEAHVCPPTTGLGPWGIMTGIHVGRNDFACALYK